MKNILIVLLLSGLLLACGGNEDNNEPEKSISEQVEDAADDVAESAEETAEDVAEGAEEAAEDVAEGAEEAADKVNDATTKFKGGSWTGKVVKLSSALTGNHEALTASRVEELVKAGQYVGFLADGNFYMVYNTGGTYDWKGLAKVAGQESVTIEGEAKKVGGLNIILAKKIAS